MLEQTASGAIETIQGSEYGLETRALCCEALATARSPQAPQMRERAEGHARSVRDSIRGAEFRHSFERRKVVVGLLDEPDSVRDLAR